MVEDPGGALGSPGAGKDPAPPAPPPNIPAPPIPGGAKPASRSMDDIWIIERRVSGFDLCVGESVECTNEIQGGQGEEMSREDGHHLSESLALQHFARLRAHGAQLWVGGDDLVEDRGVGHDGGHLLEELGRVHHRLELCIAIAQYEINKSACKPWKRISPHPQSVRKTCRTKTDHVWIVRIQPHIRERVHSRQSPIPKMAIQLRQRVVYVLAGLHRWQLLRWDSTGGGGGGGRRGGGAGGAFDHVDGVGGLDFVD